MMKNKDLVLFVVGFCFLVLLQIFHTMGSPIEEQTIKSEPPSYDYVGVYYPWVQPISNNSIVYSCLSFNITVNVSDDKGLIVLNITYDGHIDSFPLGSATSATVNDTIVISGPGVYHVELLLEDADKLIVYYYFTVICCDGREPYVSVFEDGILLTPEVPIYRCNNTTLTVVINSTDGIDIVVITIKHNGDLLVNHVYDLSTDDIDLSFVETITVPISLPGTYMVEIYARDLCNYSVSLTYLIVCNDSLESPIIQKFEAWCNKSQYSIVLSNGSCFCCCRFDLEVSVSDADGISGLYLYIDGTLVASYTPPSPTTSVYYTFEDIEVSSEGVYTLIFCAKDIYGDTTRYVIYVICDTSPPRVEAQVNDEAVSCGSTIDVEEGEVVDLYIKVSDSTRLRYVEIDAQDVPIDIRSFPSCISDTSLLEFAYTINVTEWIYIYSGLSSSILPVLRITIVAIDICGHVTTYYFVFSVTTSTTTTGLPTAEPYPPPAEKILFTFSGAAIVLGFSMASSIATLLAYTRLFKKEKSS